MAQEQSGKRKLDVFKTFELVANKQIKLSFGEFCNLEREIHQILCQNVDSIVDILASEILSYIFEYLTEERDKKGIPLIPQICKRFAEIYRSMEKTRFRLFVRRNENLIRAATLVAALELPLFSAVVFGFALEIDDDISSVHNAEFTKKGTNFRYASDGNGDFVSKIMGNVRYFSEKETCNRQEVFWFFANLLNRFREEQPRINDKEKAYDEVTFCLHHQNGSKKDKDFIEIDFHVANGARAENLLQYASMPLDHPIRVALDRSMYLCATRSGEERSVQEYIEETPNARFWTTDSWLKKDLCGSSLDSLMKFCKKELPKEYFW
jgi:hypothetical protein